MTSSLDARKRRKLEFTVQLAIETEVRLFLDFSRPMDAADNFGIALFDIRRTFGLCNDSGFQN